MIWAIYPAFAGDGALGHIARGMGTFTIEGVDLIIQAGQDEAQAPYREEGDEMGENDRGRDSWHKTIKNSRHHAQIIAQNHLTVLLLDPYS